MAKIPGFRVLRSPKKRIVVIRMDPECRPDRRDPDWRERTAALFPSRADFLREHGHEGGLAAGKAFYTEWYEHGEENYVRQVEHLLDGPIWRGWDFGHRFPSVTWCQWDQENRRLAILRSILPARDFDRHISTYSLADLVLYLSGQTGIETIADDDVAMAWLQAIESQDVVPTPPWFGPGMSFLDFSGHEALKESADVARESAEKNSADILGARGIFLNAHYGAVKAREEAMRELLKIRPDGWPGLIVDPSNWQIIEGMRGGFAYPKASRAVPIPNKVKKDGYYDNIHDSLGYVVVNVVKLEGPAEDRGEQEHESTYVGG